MRKNEEIGTDPDLDRFAGRRAELDALRMTLAGPESRTVWISGPPGMGKTSLAMHFGNSNSERFPGGVHGVSCASFQSFLDVSTNLHLPSAESPFLLIVNDLAPHVHRNIPEGLQAIRERRPTAQIIVTSREGPPPKCVHLHLQLEGLHQSEFQVRLDEIGTSYAVPTIARELHKLAQGNPLALAHFVELLRRPGITGQELLDRLGEFTAPGLVDDLGRPLSSASQEHRKILADVRTVSEAFLRELSVKPELLYQLSPRGFEELVAEMLARLGYMVTLTPASKDGGKDIYAAKKDYLGTFLYVVECKKYSPDNPVGVGLVRQLNGVVRAEQATAGILVTTSFFTRGAKEFQKTIASQISLKDYLGIREWLDEVVRKR